MALPRSVRKLQDEEQEGNPAGGNKQRGPRDGQSVTQLVLHRSTRYALTSASLNLY